MLVRAVRAVRAARAAHATRAIRADRGDRGDLWVSPPNAKQGDWALFCLKPYLPKVSSEVLLSRVPTTSWHGDF